MLEALCAEFARHFSRSPSVAVRAPGRVNLIGEHTDYNQGLVLPCAIDRDTLAVAVPRRDGRVRVHSRELGEVAEFDASQPVRRGDWVDYVAGPFFALAERGAPSSGLDLAVASRVPRESGLSSSAALGVAVAAAATRAHAAEPSGAQAARKGWDPEDWAALAHRGESHFVGVGCGIMDPYASALGRRDHALRIDCRDRSRRVVPLGDGTVRLLVAQSGVRRALAKGGYAERVAECEAALAAARAAGIGPPGARAWRDFGAEHLPALALALEPRLLRRARHVITENARVDATCEALARGDWAAVGACLRAGMASLRDDFQVSTPELDALCEIADAEPGVWGSRLTGAGFGGCTLHLVRPEAAGAVREALAEGFAARFGRRAEVLVARAADGAAQLSLPTG